MPYRPIRRMITVKREGIRDYSAFRPTGYPVRHRRGVPYDPKVSLGLEFRGYIREIRRLDSLMDGFMLSSDDYMELVKDAYASNVHWSTRIEGNRLTMDQVRDIATSYTGGTIGESRNGDVQEVLNHLHVMFSDRPFGLPWGIGTVCDVHGRLLRGTVETAPGEIRTVPVSVVDPDGNEMFIACPPGSIAEEMDALMAWLAQSPFDEIVTVALFFHGFESIHPFEDGNGRTGRTMMHILLQEFGLRNSSLCKIDEEMLADPETYYSLLAFSDAVGDCTHFVEYTVECLLSAYRKAYAQFSAKDKLSGFDWNVRHLAWEAKDAGEFALSDAVEWSGAGEQTVRHRLDSLVDAGILEKVGRTRSLRYRFMDPFRELRERIGEE